MPILTAIASPLLRRPLLCLTLGWIAGIFLAVSVPLPWGAYAILTAVGCLAWLAVPPAHGGWRAAALLTACLCLAATLTARQTAALAPDDPRYLPTGVVVLRGYPTELPTLAERGWRTVFRVQARLVDGAWHPVACTVRLLGWQGAAPQVGFEWQVLGRVSPAPTAANPYGFNLRQYLAERDYSYQVTGLALQRLPDAAPTPWLSHARRYLETRLAATMPTAYRDTAAVLNGLVLGSHATPMADAVEDDFRRTGIIHLMVVSGSQITLFGTLLLLPLLGMPGQRRGTAFPRLRVILLLASLPLLGAYVALADRGPSVDRALIMFLLTALAAFLAFSPLARRRVIVADGLTLLAASALLILIVRPVLLFSPSMQLSYAAVFGLQVVTPVLMRLVPRWPGWLALLVMATLGAEIMTFPVLAWHFGQLPVFGPLTNLVAVPLVALLLPLGVATICLAPWWPAAATVVNHVNGTCIRWLIDSAHLTAQLPWSQALWFVRSPLPLLVYATCVAAVLYALSRWADSREQDWPVPAGSLPPMW
jgi:competence protein ComEC